MRPPDRLRARTRRAGFVTREPRVCEGSGGCQPDAAGEFRGAVSGREHLSGNYLIDGFSATTTVTRSDFGIDAFTPCVGDEVEIVIEVEGVHGRKDG